MQLLLTPHKLQTILEACKATHELHAAAAEIGVFEGGTLNEIAGVCPNRVVVGFDTFEGLPEKDWNGGERHSVGEFSCSYERVYLNLLHRPNVRLIKGYFPDSFDQTNPDIPTFFSMVHVDVDFGDGILNCLQAVWPRMLPGGIVVVDDYDWPHTPQVKPAVSAFLEDCPFKPSSHFEKKFQYVLVK